LILYDLRTAQKVYLPIHSDWRVTESWLPDGRIKIITNFEEVEAVGITFNYDLFDPITQEADELTEVFDLPYFQFFYNYWWDGYASIDPSRTMVFYTALPDNATDFVLRDTVNNSDLWQYDSGSFQAFIPIASWTSDGQNVAFAAEDKSEGLQHILSLNIQNLELTELTTSPSWVRSLSWTSDSRYFHYSQFELGWDEGPGFIIDTQLSTQYDICAEGYVFNKGLWIENTDLMLYTLHSPTSTRVALLDVSNWETQTLTELGPDIIIDIIGWTPITLP
jgi:Tol biopolymer transport system component